MAETNGVQVLLEQLKARKAAIENAIAALEAVAGELGDIAVVGSTSKSAVIEADTFIGMNINQAAEKYLQMTGRPAKSTELIASALNQGGLNVSLGSVSTILRRSDNGESPVTRVGRSLWGLASWYPNKPRRTQSEGSDRAVHWSKKRSAERKERKSADATVVE
jgi:hypothetical protein